MVAVVQTVGQAQNIWNNPPNFQTFFSFYDFLGWLQKMQRAAEALLASARIGPIDASEGIVELALIEYAGEVGIDPARLGTFVSEISELYTVVAIVLQKSDHFTFKYFDSGSDFLAGIISVKEVAESVNIFLSQWFDRFRFWKYDKFDKDLDTVTKTLDLAAKIHENVKNGALSAEDGENLTRRAFKAMDALTNLGVTPVARGVDITPERKQFLNELRKMKLLTGTTEGAGATTAAEDSQPQNSA